MANDLKQVVAAVLTFCMFVALKNMIKRGHMDTNFETKQGSLRIADNEFNVSKNNEDVLVHESYGPWQEQHEAPKPCWKIPTFKGKHNSTGYILFSLTHGPEFHASQVVNAMEVARRLGATLALPDIKLTKFGEKKAFRHVYDVNNFVTALKGVVRVDEDPPIELLNSSLHVVRIPERVSEGFIDSKIMPIFRVKRNLRIVTALDFSQNINVKENKSEIPYRCLAMFESLKLQAEFQQLVDAIVRSLRSFSQKSNGRFVAVDLSAEMMQERGCQEADSLSKPCSDGAELAEFLTTIGFKEQVTLYLTQTRWQGAFLKRFRNAFPNTFTKDVLIPAYAKEKFLHSETSGLERFIDFYICTQGDVFVPAIMGRFCSSVVGQRVASGRTQVFVQSKKIVASNDSANDHLFRNDDAHFCFC